MTSTLFVAILSLLILTAVVITLRQVAHGGYRSSRSPLRHLESDWSAGGLPADRYTHGQLNRFA